MGYCMSQIDHNFFIPKDKLDAARDALRAIATKTEHMGGGSRSKPSYSWVNMEYVNKPTLEGAMNDWRWALEMDDEGNVCGIQFEGEKLGDDQRMFDAIAPFVQDGSFIEMDGEDGTRWRWVFQSGECIEKEAKISWD